MPDYYLRAAWRGGDQTAEQVYVNALHFQCSSLASLGDLSGSANAILARFETEYRALIVDFQNLIDLTVSAEKGSFAPLATVELPINVKGTRAGLDFKLSEGLCGLITLRTALAGKSFRGRVFCFPAVTSPEVVDGGLWGPTSQYFVAMEALAAKLSQSWTVGNSDFTPIVYSRTRQERAEVPFVSNITAAVAQPKQHFLRSRQN